MDTNTVVLRNKGTRTYRLADGPGGVRRELEPSRTLAVSEAEALQHLNYTDIEDAAIAVPQTAKVIEELRAENNRLRAERDKQNANIQAVSFAPKTDVADIPHAVHVPVPSPMDTVAPQPKMKKQKGK